MWHRNSDHAWPSVIEMKGYQQSRALYIDDSHKEDVITELIDDGDVWSEGMDAMYDLDREGRMYGLAVQIPDEDVFRGLEFQVIPLSRLMSDHSMETVTKMLNGYRSGYAMSFGPRLRDDAVRCEKDGTYRTFLAVSRDGDILGYYMLGLGHMVIPEGNALPPFAHRALGLKGSHGISSMMMLAQLSHSMRATSVFIPVLMALANRYVSSTKGIIGPKFVMLECDDEDILCHERRGFRVIERVENTNRMVAMI